MAHDGVATKKPASSPPLLRKGIPGERKPLKEKLITYYEQIFKVSSLAPPVELQIERILFSAHLVVEK